MQSRRRTATRSYSIVAKLVARIRKEGRPEILKDHRLKHDPMGELLRPPRQQTVEEQAEAEISRTAALMDKAVPGLSDAELDPLASPVPAAEGPQEPAPILTEESIAAAGKKLPPPSWWNPSIAEMKIPDIQTAGFS